MSTMPWIKSHTKQLEDIRIMRTSEDGQLAYFKLSLLAGKCDAEGSFTMNGEQLSDDEIAFYIRMDVKKLKAAMKELTKNRLMSVNGHGPMITDFPDEQVSQAKRQESWRDRQNRHRSVTGDTSEVTSDSDVTPASRTRVKNQNQKKNQSKNKNQPTPTPSSNNGKSSSGRVAGSKDKSKNKSADSLSFQNLKGTQRKRADQAMKILSSLGIRNPKLETTSVLLATRHYKNDEQMINEMFAAIASAYADNSAKSKEAVTLHRIETGKIPQSFIDDRSLWRSVPVKTLELAGITNIDNDKYKQTVEKLRQRGLTE